MNRIFKVLWNKSVKRFVVTNEVQRSRRKAKNETLAIGAALITLLPLPIDSAFASEITKPSNWSNTTITTSGKVTNITNPKVQGDIGIHKFSKFNVSQGNIANLHLADGTNNLVNFVNDKISIDGTVNSLKGSKVGGNLFFVTPSGMTVGATGVINAGSLTAVVTTEKAFDNWTGDLDEVNSTLLTKMQNGAVPLNRTGVITVNGSINTGNKIVLAASQINIGSTATLTNQRALNEFKTLVNIPASSGVEAVSAGVDGTLEAKETTDGTGDILLIARTDTSASSSATFPDLEAKVDIAGKVYSREDIAVGAIAGNGEYDEDTKTFVLGTSDKSSIATLKANVAVSGTVEAAKNVDIDATVTNHVKEGGLIHKIESLTFTAIGATTGINEAAAYGSLTSKATVTVAENASITSGGNLTINATSDTYLDVGASFTSVKLLENIEKFGGAEKKIPGGAAVVTFIDSSSSVVIDGKLTTAGDLTIASKDTLKGSATAAASHGFSNDNNPGHIAFVFAKFDGSSSVTISDKASISLKQKTGATTGGKVSISSKRKSNVSTTADATVEKESYGAIAFNYTEHNTSSSVTVNTGLGGVSAESLTIASENITERESMYAQTRSGFLGGIKLKIGNIVQGFSENVVAGLMGKAAQGINNNFTAEEFRVGGTVGVISGTQSSTVTIAPSVTLKAAGNVAIESLSKKLDHHYTVYAQSDGVKPGGDAQEGEVKVAGSIGLLISVPKDDDTVTSNLTIGDNAVIQSTAGTLTINNTAEISYYRVKAMIEDLLAKVELLKKIYTAQGGTDWSQVQNAVDAIDVKSQDYKTLIKYTGGLVDALTTTFSNATTVIGTLGDVYGLVINACQFIQLDSYVNSYVTASGASDNGKLAFGGALGVVINTTSSNLSIGKGAKLTVGTAGSATKGELTVVGASINESVALSGHMASFLGIALPTTTKGNSFGASVLIQSLKTNNTVTIREGAELKDLTGIGAVKVAASDRIENVTLAASGDISEGNFGISANAAAAMSTGVNRLSIDDEATVSAGSVTLQANRKDNNQAIVGTLSVGSGDTPSKNVGASVAINLIDLKNNLAIEDNDKLLEGETSQFDLTGLLEATKADGDGVSIAAHEDTTVNAIGVSGDITTSGTGEQQVENDENPNVLKRFADWVGQKTESASTAINDTLANLQDKAQNWGNGAGKAIRKGVKKILRQNAEGNENINNGDPQDIANPGDNPAQNMVDADGNAAADANQNIDPMGGNQARRFQIGLAASVGWNTIDLENKVTIDAESLTIKSPKLNVEAVTDKWIGAWAGGAAVSYVNANNAQTSSAAGAGGAIAVNSGTLTNVVTISKGLTLDTNVESVAIRAVNCGTIVAEGLSMGIAMSSSEEAGNQYSFDASVSVNLLKNTVKADVSSVTQNSGGTKTLAWDEAAFNGETQVTGGTGFGVSIQSGDSSARSLGFIVAYAEIENIVASAAKSVTLVNANQFNVKALTSVTQVTTAIGANVTTGDSSTSFTGAAAATNFINTVNAEVSDSTITLSDGATTQIIASGITDTDAKTYKDLSDWEPESKASDRENLSEELDNSSFYNGVILKTDREQVSADGQKLSELGKKTGLHQTTVVVSTAVSVKKGAGGAAIAVNNIDNNFTTAVSSSSIKEASGSVAGTYTQRAESNATSVAVATGVAASPSGARSHYALAGSVIVSNVDQKSVSSVTGSTIASDTVAIESADKATTVNVAGGVNLSLGGNGSAAGAALVVMNTNNRAEISITGGSTLEAATLATKTLNKANAWGVSVDVSAAKEFGFAGSVTVNRVKNESLITVNNLTLKDITSEATFAAEDESQLWTLAGAVAFGVDTAGLSGAVAYSISGRDGSVGTKVDVTDLTVKRTKGKGAGSLTFSSTAKDKVHTLVLAAGVSTQGAVGFGGAAGVGEVKRDTIASVNNLKTVMLSDTDGSEITDNTDAILGGLTIEATETSGVYNLGIAGAYGDSAGIGIGVAVNRITTTTKASLTADATNTSRVKTGSLVVKAKTADDIENIAIGGSGAQSFALTGSIAVNKLTDNTKTKLENVKVDVAGPAIVHAQSDDVIGSYVGQISGANTAAGGLSILVNNRFGDTTTEVTSSEVKQTATAAGSLSLKGAVNVDKINKKIVNDISTAASLEDDREETTVDGIYIDATSTATFKSFVINGAGAGTGSGTGSATVTYHGGTTKTIVSASTLEAVNDLTIDSGNYVNVDNILTVAAFAGTGAGELAINVATTDHETATSIDGDSLTSTSGAVKANAEAKEGVSSLAIAGSGTGTGAGGVLVNVTRELSKVTTEISKTNQTAITGKTVNVSSDYLGRLNALAISANGAGIGAGNVNVIVNYSDNAIKTDIGNAQIKAVDSVTISSLRRTENSGIDIAGSGGLYGGMSATVLVNTVEGSSETKVAGAKITGKTLSETTEATPTIAITSDGEDVFDLVGVTATGALFGSAGALVSVNRFLATSQTTVDASTISGKSVTITAAQNRDIDATNVFASLSLGTLGANVLATVVGSGGDPFATSDTKLTDLETQVKNYTQTYAGSSTSDSPGIFSKVIAGTQNTLTEDEKTEMLKAAAKSAAAADQTGGTHVKVTGSQITAKGTNALDAIKITAEEDTASFAHKKITVGNGELAGGVFAGSVATLREKRNLTTEVTGSVLTANSKAIIGTAIGGKSELNSIQAIVAGASAAASYVDIDIQGGSNVVLNATKLSVGTDGDIRVSSEDASKTEGYSFGINVSGVSGAGIVANTDDKSSVAINISNNSAIAGAATIEAVRATERKSEVKAGIGGALNGTGALATVDDTGGAKVSITGLTTSGRALEVLAINKADLYTKSYQGYLSAITIGVLKATTKASGETSLTVTSSKLNSEVVELNASTGTVNYDTDNKLVKSDALFLTSQVYSYGCSIVGGFVGNNAVAENTTTTNLTVEDNLFNSAASLVLSEYGFAYYDVYSDLGTGGVVAEGASYANINHAAKLTNTIASHSSGNDVGLFYLVANNIEDGTLKAYSAGGSVIDMSAKAAHVDHKDTSSITSTLSGSWEATEGILISSASTHKLDFLADNTKGVVIGGSSAQLENSMNGANTITITGDWSSDSSFYASAVTNIDLGAVEGKTYAVDNAVYGAINGANGTLENTLSRDTIVNISENTTITAKNDLDIASQTIENSSLRVRARTAGVAAGVTAYNDNKITEKTLINLKNGAKLTNLDADSELTVSASTSATRVIESIGDLQGAVFGGAGAKSVNSVTQTNEVTTEANSQITGAGKVNLYAGRDIMGDEEDFNFTAYTHAYAHSIGGTDNELNDTFNIANRLTLSGDVLAVRSIDATADIGTWSLSEISRYWELLSSKDAAKVVRIASSAEGKKSVGTFNPVNSIVLNGTLTAGTQTKSIITIQGLVDPGQADYTIEGETVTSPSVTTEGIEATVSSGSESVANLYKTRYETLLSLIADFREGDGNQTAVISYRKEAELLRQKMIDQGLAVFKEDGTILSLVDNDYRGFVKVSDIAVAGGDVNLRADSVTGAGAITANAAETITIDNQTNLALTVENIRILEKGGNLTLNGLTVTGKPDQFSGSVVSKTTAGDPTVKITSKYSGGKVKMTATKSDGTVLTKEITPDNTITVNGVVANDAGSLTMSAVGDIFVGGGSGSRLAAATALSLSATRSVVQSYTTGIKNVAGGIETLWQEAVDRIKGGTESSYNTGTTAKVPQSEGIIAGEDLFISADNINLNGLVQSGYATWSVDMSQADLEAKITQLKVKWQKAGAKSDVNPISSDYLISEGGHYKKDDGTYGMRVAAWYDPVNDRVIVDDIKPQGGHIYLTGRISSTGGGKVYAASGTADVSINAGNHSVRLGDITTQNGSGLIEITDTTDPGSSTTSTGSKAVAKVYRWENDGTTTTTSAKILYQDGTLADFTGATVTDTSFTPTAGLSYVWSDGYRTGTVETKETSQHFLWWSAWDSGDPSTWTTETTTKTLDNEALGSGMTLDVGLHKDSNYKFNSWVTTTTVSQGEWKKTDWVTYDNWTHFSGDNHSKAVRTSTGTKIYTYSVKADEKVDVGFLNASNKVDVTSAADIVLSGQVTAEKGTVNFSAKRNIINEASDASVVSASTVALKAGGSIGEAGSAIRVLNAEGALTLSAEASLSGSIYIDASPKTENAAAVTATNLKAGSVNLTTQGALNVTNLVAYESSLVSSAGDIVVADLDQMAADDDISRRFDATATAGSVTLTSANDIAVGKIKAKETVTVTSTAGNVWDALSREDLDNRNAEEKLRVWKEAGILGEDGANNGATRWAEDVATQEAIVKADFSRYQSYQSMSSLSEAQTQDFEALKTRFAGVETADAALAKEKANASSNLAQTIAAKDDYGWSKTELLYAVSKAIVNPDSGSAPQAGDTNIEAKVISINASQSAGTELNTQTFKFSEIDASTDKGMEAYKVLALADVDDVKWDKDNESVSVTLKRPISIKLTGTDDTSYVAGSAEKGFYAASDEKLRVGIINASAATVRLTSKLGIEAIETASDVANINATKITLRGGTGSLGTSETPIKINSSGAVSLSADESIHIQELGSELRLVAASTKGELDLRTEKIIPVEEDGQGSDGYISAGTISLDGKDIGTSEKPLRIQVKEGQTTTLAVKQQSFGSFNLDVSGEGTLALSLVDGKLETTSDLTLKTEGTLLVDGQLASGNDLTLTSDILDINGTLIATNALTLNADSMTIKESAVLQSNDIDLNASEGDINLTGATFKALDGSSNSDISIHAENGNVSLEDVKFTDTQATTLTIASGKGSITLSSEDSETTTYLKELNLEAEKEISVTGYSLHTENALVLDANVVQVNDATLSSVNTLRIEADELLNVKGATVKSESSTLTLTSSAGEIQASGATIAAKDLVQIQAKEDVNLQDAVVVSENSDITVLSEDGTVNLALTTKGSPIAFKAKAIAITSKDIDLTNRFAFASDSINVTATDSITATSSELLSTNDFTLNASNVLDASGATLKSTEGTLTLTSETKSIEADLATLEAKGQVSVNAQSSVDLTNAKVTSTGSSISVSATDGKLNGEGSQFLSSNSDVTLSAGTDANLKNAQFTLTSGKLSVRASDGNIDLSSSNSSNRTIQAEKIEITGGLLVNLAQRFASATETLTVNASGAIAVNSAQLEAKTISLDADLGINAKSAKITSMSVTMKSDSGNIVATDAQIEAVSSAQVTAYSDIHLDGATVKSTGASISVSSSNGALDGSSSKFDASHGNVTLSSKGNANLQDARFIVSGTGELSVKTSQGSIDLSSSNATNKIEANRLTVESGSSLNMKSRSAKTTGALSVTAKESIDANKSVIESAGALTIKSDSNIELESATVKATSTDEASTLSLTSGGSIQASSATIESKTSTAIKAQQEVNLENALINSENGTLTIATTTDSGIVNLSSSSSEKTIKAEVIDVTGGLLVNLANRVAKATDALTVNATVAIAGNSSVLEGKSVSLDAALGINAKSARITSTGTTGTSITLNSGSGNIVATDAQIMAASSAQITAYSDIDLGNASVSSTGASIAVSSSNGVLNGSSSKFDASNGDVTLSSKGNANLKDAKFTVSNSGELSVTTSQGSIDLSSSDTTNKIEANRLTVESGSGVNMTSRAVKTTEALSVTAKESIDANKSVIESAGALTVKSDANIGLEGATVKATSTDAASTLSLTSGGSIQASSATIKSSASTEIKAKKEVNLSDAAINSESGTLTIATTTNLGIVNLSSSSSEKTIKAKNIDIAGGLLVNLVDRIASAAESLTVKATVAIAGNSAQLEAKAVSLDAALGMNAKKAKITATGTSVTMNSSKGTIIATEAEIKSVASAEVNAYSDVELQNATVTVQSTDASISLTSTNGSVKASEVSLNTPKSIDVNAQRDADFKDAKFSMMSGTIHIVSSKGNVGVAASSEDAAYALYAKNLIIEAGRDIDFRGRKAYLGEQTRTSRSRLLRATIPDDATGMIVFESSESIYADGATLTGSSIELNSSAGDLFARNANLTSTGKFSLAAGGDIDVSETTLTANSTSEKLILNSSYGNVYAKNATLTSPVEIDIAANKDISLSGTTSLTNANKVTLTSEFGLVDLSGDVEITAPTIVLKSEYSDIFLADDVKLTATASVLMDAGEGILQVDRSVIEAPELIAVADDSILLQPSIGNKVPTVTLNSAYGSVGFNTAVDTTLTVNNNNLIYGDVWFEAPGKKLTLTNSLASYGQISVRAKSFEAPVLISSDGVYVSTNFNNDEEGTSIKVDGILSSEIGLMTDKGSIDVGILDAIDGSVSVYRTSLDTFGTISIGDRSYATSNGFIYNGNGNITSGLISDEFVQLMIGRSGTVTQLPNTKGSSSYVMRNLSYLSSAINEMTLEMADDYKWFPMMDWRKLGYTYIVSFPRP